jgi:hypothetical protein
VATVRATWFGVVVEFDHAEITGITSTLRTGAASVGLLTAILAGFGITCCSPRTTGHGHEFPRAAMNSRGERYPSALCG